MADQLDAERRLVGDATNIVLLKEMFLVPSNRKRALISIFLMICQQMTGVNSIVIYSRCTDDALRYANTWPYRTTMLLRSSRVSA